MNNKKIKKGQNWRLGYQAGYKEAEKKLQRLIVEEINACHYEVRQTNHLTSLYNKFFNE